MSTFLVANYIKESKMYPCPRCKKLEMFKPNSPMLCECGIYKMLVKSNPPYWMEVQKGTINEERDKLYNNTKLGR